MQTFATAAAVLLLGSASAHESTQKPSAAELRRYEGSSDCTGKYSVVNTDELDSCTAYAIPAPASIKVAQINDTAYASYHYQGTFDCTGNQEQHLEDLIVGTCTDYGDYSQMRTWVRSAPATDGACEVPGNCGLAYQACCAGAKLTGDECSCHLHNGTGSADSTDCGKCGNAYVACCLASGLTGHPCTCDVKDSTAAATIVV